MQHPVPNPEMNMQQPQPSAGDGHVHQGECAQPAPNAHQPHHYHGKPKPRRRFFRRFITGYLMITGALVNILLIIELVLYLAWFLTDRFAFI